MHGNEAATNTPSARLRIKDDRCSIPGIKAKTGCGIGPATPEQVLRRDALEEMFVALRSKFVATAYSILQNREDAEEAVQEAFLSAHCHLRNFEGRSALKTWLTRIVMNSALMMRRKRKPIVIKSLSEAEASNEEDWAESLPDLYPNPEMIH